MYARIVLLAPGALVNLLASSCSNEKSYAAEPAKDLHWLWTTSCFPEGFGLLDPLLHPTMWSRLVSAYPNRFRRAVQNAEHIECQAIEFAEKPAVQQECIVCHLCGVSCKTADEYHGHMARLHGHRKPFKIRVSGTQRLYCVKIILTGKNLSSPQTQLQTMCPVLHGKGSHFTARCPHGRGCSHCCP